MSLYDWPELYDAQYAHYRDDLAFYTRLAEDYAGTRDGPVLELGAGSGRVTAALARAGFTVMALERSAAMLERARSRLAAAGLAERVRPVQGDMRSFRSGERHPLVIAPFNAFMHLYSLADQDATLANVRAQLAAGGAFALDLYNPNFAGLERLKLEREWQQSAVEGLGDGTGELFVYQRCDPERQLLESRYYLDTADHVGRLTRRTARLEQRYFTRFELERALRQAGFAQLRFYGDFERGPYRQAAPQLIAVARV